MRRPAPWSRDHWIRGKGEVRVRRTGHASPRQSKPRGAGVGWGYRGASRGNDTHELARSFVSVCLVELP
jgi:hypothetical protein